MKALEKLREVAAFFKAMGIEDPAREAELLITEIIKTDKSRLYAADPEIPNDISKEIDGLSLRRAKGEPLQYIIGHVEFYGLFIHVGRGVLIPRPETELLVDEAIRQLKAIPSPQILDLCTGSGCIAVAIAKNLPHSLVCAIDRSETALDYATRNAQENRAANIRLLRGDLFQPVREEKFHCIISNPPYIRKKDIPTLQREVREYEPHEALDGGEDGLEFYRRIFHEGPFHLHTDGLLIMEIGHDQADEIEALALVAGFRDIRLLKDYAGIRRIFMARWKGKQKEDGR
ncbi:MAG: peptide chain release factor N(5)-glutamine methyltransferase [Nitrospirales bacterium]|nr:peptide chain release factor N(5)-glutamine methyltransferase [Nitrospirales bacterium]